MAERQDVRPHESGGIEPREEADHHDQLEHALLEDAVQRPLAHAAIDRGADHDEEEQQRERHHEIRQPRDHGVDQPAEVAGRAPEDDAEQDRDERRAERDLERVAPAVEDSQELVAAERAVGTQQQERLRRPLRRRRMDEREGVVVRDDGRVPGDGERAHRPEVLDRVGELVVGSVPDRPLVEVRAGEAGEEGARCRSRSRISRVSVTATGSLDYYRARRARAGAVAV
jgi:hypothetical protein